MRRSGWRGIHTARAARGLAGIVVVVAMTLAVSGCGGPTPTADRGPSADAVTIPPTTAPSATTVPAASTGRVVARDDSLLAVLPGELDGVPVQAEEDSFSVAVSDPAFAGAVERAAFAIVVSPDDLASGVVAQPREGLLDAAFFQDWRETYNEGACAQAGGVATNAETELGGRTVHITTCADGITVYHALLEERGLIVSLFSLGEGRYGERLMGDLRP